MKRKSIIIGVKGKNLSKYEIQLLRSIKPWGVILFERNIFNISQLKKLTGQIKKCFNDDNFPILIDQEGGRVSRLNAIFNFTHYSQKYFGERYVKNNNKFFEKYYANYINFLCGLLNFLGININISPVLDVREGSLNSIIGDRSFSNNQFVVNELGKLCIKLHHNNKIGTVIKHVPGHGSSEIDSHFSLPSIKISKSELLKRDFFPFVNSKSFFAMTAHVKFVNFDSKNPATHSKIIINDIVRKKMNFNGLIMTDDISMNALKFDLKKNVIKALDAGCNLILHCNGNYFEAKQISKIVPFCDDFVSHKTKQFYKLLN